MTNGLFTYSERLCTFFFFLFLTWASVLYGNLITFFVVIYFQDVTFTYISF